MAAIMVQRTALFAYLKDLDEQYAGKDLEVHEVLTKWLEYVPNTFPHYTQHTIEHSDEIVRQLSHLLFTEDEGRRCVIPLSAVEAYILIACAFLHDAGMVASDAEKQQMLESESWKKWIATTASEQWQQIEGFRRHGSGVDRARHFVADMRTRELISEFVRRVHHRRAANVIRNQSELGRFAFDDPQLQQTVSDICVAHGLDRNDLDDPDVYPTLRQIRGENVNVRLLAILLRLGDLLDLRVSRACPILFNAADPIGPTSKPHWSQYTRIRQFAVDPVVIEVRAECEDIDEHRVLRDWCQWIVDETRDAPRLLADSRRHQNWRPPRASLTGERPTISIAPAKEATYLVRDWRFELDADAIFQRLIVDVHSDQYAFIGELIQNALDATRCRMYEDLKRDGEPAPSSPADVAAEIRRRYALRLRTERPKVRNEHANRDEVITTVAIEDCGIGMDEDVVQRHLLQVGRSYYTTEEFRRRYAFVPASQFGVGFLTVFSVSDDIIVESLRQKGDTVAVPLQLRLCGPRNYMAVARGTRVIPGTRIEVRVRPDVQFEPGTLTKLVRSWCKKVEFPIEISDFGTKSTILAEDVADFIFNTPDAEHRSASYVLRPATVADRELKADLYWLVHESPLGEDWTRGTFYQYSYGIEHPEADIPRLPRNLACIHGIAMSEHGPDSGQISRIDYRGRSKRPNLARTAIEDIRSETSPLRVIYSKWCELLSKHIESSDLAKDSSGWIYRNKLADSFPIPANFWDRVPGRIPVVENGALRPSSWDDFARLPRITELISRQEQHCLGGRPSLRPTSVNPEHILQQIEGPTVLSTDFGRLSERDKQRLLASRSPEEQRWIDNDWFAIDWILSDEPPLRREWNRMFFERKLGSEKCISIYLDHPFRVPNVVFINSRHPLGRWCAEAFRKSTDEDIAKNLATVLAEAANYCFHVGKQQELLRKHLLGWSAKRDLDAKPPEYFPSDEDFIWLFEQSC